MFRVFEARRWSSRSIGEARGELEDFLEFLKLVGSSTEEKRSYWCCFVFPKNSRRRFRCELRLGSFWLIFFYVCCCYICCYVCYAVCICLF